MDFFTVQSLNTYTRNMEMELKWQKKKENNDFAADGSKELDFISKQAEDIRKANADGSAKMAGQIDLKLNSGKKLTAEEMDYLQKHDPQKYQKVKQMEAEQENYEKELKRCRTKEEVQRVKMTHTAASFAAVNNIKNNPAIPEEKKLELIMHEHHKNMAFQETTKQFVEKGEYEKLPTEEERLKAEREQKEAKEEELAADGDTAQESVDAGAETMRQAEAEAAKREVREVLNEQEMSRTEAETTPEARKVKRARAEEAYKKNQTGGPSVQTLGRG